MKDDSVIVVDKPFQADGCETHFGRRWGGFPITIGEEEMAALQSGRTLAVDVNDEYVVFVKYKGE